MAENNAAEKIDAAAEQGAPQSKSNSILLYALLVVNMIVVLVVGLSHYLQQEQPSAVEQIAAGVAKEKGSDEDSLNRLVPEMIPLEVFLVNLSGTDGSRLLKVNLELEVDGSAVVSEIDRRQPQIRDIIILTLSSKSYEEISSQAGKDRLREEIRDTLNSFLTRGKVQRVLYTEFIFN